MAKQTTHADIAKFLNLKPNDPQIAGHMASMKGVDAAKMMGGISMASTVEHSEVADPGKVVAVGRINKNSGSFSYSSAPEAPIAVVASKELETSRVLGADEHILFDKSGSERDNDPHFGYDESATVGGGRPVYTPPLVGDAVTPVAVMKAASEPEPVRQVTPAPGLPVEVAAAPVRLPEPDMWEVVYTIIGVGKMLLRYHYASVESTTNGGEVLVLGLDRSKREEDQFVPQFGTKISLSLTNQKDRDKVMMYNVTPTGMLIPFGDYTLDIMMILPEVPSHGETR